MAASFFAQAQRCLLDWEPGLLVCQLVAAESLLMTTPPMLHAWLPWLADLP